MARSGGVRLRAVVGRGGGLSRTLPMLGFVIFGPEGDFLINHAAIQSVVWISALPQSCVSACQLVDNERTYLICETTT